MFLVYLLNWSICRLIVKRDEYTMYGVFFFTYARFTSFFLIFKGSINRLIYQKGVNMYGIWKTAWVGWISWDQLLYRYTIIFMDPMGKMVPGKQPLRESFNQLETQKTQVVPVAQVWRFYWCWCECVYWSEIFFLTVSIEFFESCLEGSRRSVHCFSET